MLPTHKDDLGKKNDDFLLRVRWLDFPGASLHFDTELRQEFVERYDEADDLKITRFDAMRIDADIPQEKVTIHYLLEYYILPSVTVKKKRFSLTWEKQPSGVVGEDYWRIMEPFPELP
jgi:hypothetical protein